VQGKEKFVEQFVGDDDDDETLAQQEAAEATAAAGHKTKAALKPAEHRALFSGNLDDHFR
jgi:U3 small nucleolar RNA-associated protein 25